MERKKIVAKWVTLRKPTGYFPLISKYKSGVLTLSKLPIPVILQDEFTFESVEAELIEVVPFTLGVVPSIFCHLAEGYPNNELVVARILERNKVTQIENLAFYLYKYHENHMHNSNPELFEEIHR